jgi:hypothetical protein
MSNSELISIKPTCKHFLQVASDDAVVALNATTETARMSRRANISALVIEDANNVKKGLNNG